MISLIFSKRCVSIFVLAGALGVTLIPSSFPPLYARALGLTIFTIGFWATGVIPEYLTALALFAAAMLLGVSPAGVIFSGFASSVVWLVFGGLVLGVAIKQTGLAERIAGRLASTFGQTYTGIVTGMVAIGMALGFMVPATVSRVFLLSPIAISVAEQFGFARGSNGYTGIIMAAVFGTFLPTFSIITANAPTLVLAGTAETLYDIAPVYGEFLLLHLPVLGILKAVLLIGVILRFFPDKTERQREKLKALPPMTVAEKKLTVILALTVGFWLTDFIHHISAAWIGLSAGVLCMLPVVDLVTKKDFKEEVNFGILFFLAGIIGFSAMLGNTGIGDQLAKFVLATMPLKPGAPFLSFLSITIISFITGILTTLPAVPAVLAPLAGLMARAAGLSIETTLMIQVIGFSMLMFPYQAPPAVLAIQMGGLKPGVVIRFFAVINILTLILLVPLDYLWWRILGWI